MNDSHTQSSQQTSVVGRCDATSCRHNEDQECRAGQIEVAMSGQMAQCLTYTPQEGVGDSQRPGQSTR